MHNSSKMGISTWATYPKSLIWSVIKIESNIKNYTTKSSQFGSCVSPPQTTKETIWVNIRAPQSPACGAQGFLFIVNLASKFAEQHLSFSFCVCLKIPLSKIPPKLLPPQSYKTMMTRRVSAHIHSFQGRSQIRSTGLNLRYFWYFIYFDWQLLNEKMNWTLHWTCVAIKFT